MQASTRARFIGAVSLTAAIWAIAADSPPNAAASQAAATPEPPLEIHRQNPLDILGVRDVARLEEAVAVPLRDGTTLMATLVIPNDVAKGRRFPTILDQSPYPAQMEFMGGRALLANLVRNGYVIAVVNNRGTQWSEGEYHWLKGAAADGADVVGWVGKQEWSDGAVGAWGCSSSGEAQFPLAKARPPGLKALVAMGAATGVGRIPGFADRGVFYTGGVPLFAWAWWYHGDGYLHHPKLPAGLPREERLALMRAFSPVAFSGMSQDLSWAGHLPSQDLLRAIGSPEAEFDMLIRMAPNDPRWNDYDFLNAGDSTTVPMLHMDTWYDSIEAYGTTKTFEYLSANSPNQYLIVGPGRHCSIGRETGDMKVGDRPVGDARWDYVGQVTRWFDHWLKDDGRGTLDMPRVQYYPLDSSRWVAAAQWPPAYGPNRLYLASGGHANSVAGDGRLLDQPTRGTPDRFDSNPLDPVPSRGGGCCAAPAMEQADVEARQDVLVYTSAPLARPLEVAGYISATLYVSTSVPDTDIAFKLVDVYPDGKAYNVVDTMQRLRYRNGIDRPELLQPGRVYRIDLRQMVLAAHFGAGHRLRIQVAGSNFPGYERNLNTGGNNYDETRAVTAHTVIYHEPGRHSYVELPVVH